MRHRPSQRAKSIGRYAEHRWLRRLLATLLCAVLAWSRPAFAQDQSSDEAKQHFQRGIELVDASRFEDASVEFETAFALRPHTAVLYNIGMAHVAARRPAAALRAFTSYLERGGEALDPPRAVLVRAQIATLRTQVASLEIRVLPPQSVVRLDGAVVTELHAVLVDSGSHNVLASAPGYVELSQNLVLRSGEVHVVELILDPLPKAPTTAPPTTSGNAHAVGGAADSQAAHDQARAARTRRAWLAASTGLAGVVLAGVTTALVVGNHARYSRWEQQQAALDAQWVSAEPPSDLSQQQAANDQMADRIKLQDEVSVGVGVASGACLIVAAAVWFAGGASDEPRTAWVPSRNGARLRFTW